MADDLLDALCDVRSNDLQCHLCDVGLNGARWNRLYKLGKIKVTMSILA